LAHQKDLRWKKRQPENAKGLIKKTSDEKRGNSKNAKGLIKKSSDEKRGNPKEKGWSAPENCF
jgi:hypothetical protein